MNCFTKELIYFDEIFMSYKFKTSITSDRIMKRLNYSVIKSTYYKGKYQLLLLL